MDGVGVDVEVLGIDVGIDVEALGCELEGVAIFNNNNPVTETAASPNIV